MPTMTVTAQYLAAGEVKFTGAPFPQTAA